MSERATWRNRDLNIVWTAGSRTLTGFALIAVFWIASWMHVRPISDYYFFPLWLGYILAVDGLVALRTGTSPIERASWRVIWFFAVSIPLWWVFEAFNAIIDNWHYQTPVHYTALEYALLASVAFSTVVPAVLTTTELVSSFAFDPLRRLPRIEPTRTLLVAIHLTGWVMIAVTVRWPAVFFPLVWLSLVFVLDPIATWLGGQSLAWHVARRDWSPLFNIAIATLICGWLWEMWNVYSLPKWTYDLPYAEQLRVFEMPLPGYGGYIPFGYEVFVFALVARRVLPWLDVPVARVSSRPD